MVDFIAKNVIRIVSGVVIVGAVTVLANSMVPVASHHQASVAATCTAAASGVGSLLTIKGSGYAASTTYLVDIKWPAGNTSGQSSGTDGSGNLNAWNYAYYAGSYSVAVFTMGNHPTQIASCSTTVS
jgi:hypothetical protein